MIENNIRNASFWCLINIFTENRNFMRSYETRKAVLLKTYLASHIKVPILSFMQIDYDVYDLACIQLLL